MNRYRIGSSVVSASLLVLAPCSADAVRVDYVLEAGIEYDDNARMSANAPESEMAFRAGAGFLVSQDSSVVQANVEGRVDYWNYTRGVQSGTIEGMLSGRLNWVMLPERLSFTIEDHLEMRPVDRFSPDSSDNRQWVNTLALGPNVHFNWSQSLRARALLRWISTSAELDDAIESQRVAAAFHVSKQIDPSSDVTFAVQTMDADFDNDLLARDFRRYDAYARYLKELARLSFGISAGHSWVKYEHDENASYPLIRGDLRWQATERSSLALAAARQLSDASTASIDGIDASGTVPGGVVVDGTAVEGSVYEENSISLTYAYEGDRTGFMVGPYFEKTDYLDEDAIDETTRGVRAEVRRRLDPTWEVSFYGDVSRSRLPDFDRELEDRRIGANLTKRWSRHWSGSLRYSRYERDDSAGTSTSAQNIWYLVVTYRNR